jgi:hypothetical protein
VSQDTSVDLDTAMQLRLRITGAVGAYDDLEIRVVAHPRVDDLERFAEVAATESLDSFKDSLEVPLTGLERFGNGDVVVPVPLQPRGEDPDYLGALQVTSPGVYPLEVVVRDGRGNELGAARSWLVATDPEVEPTVQLAWRWEWQPPPQVGRDGVTPTDDFVVAARPGGAIGVLADQLEAADLPITFVVSPQALDAWSRAATLDPEAANTYERVQAVLGNGRHELLPVPYVPIDGPALEASGLGPRVPESYLIGAQTLDDRLGRRPDPATTWADPVDTASLTRLGETFAYRVVLPADAITGPAPDDVGSILVGSRSIAALTTRPDLAVALVEPGTAGELPGSRVARLVATLALASAGRERPMPVVLDAPSDPAVLRALSIGLADQRIAEASTVADLFAAAPTATIELAERPDPADDGLGPLDVIAAERTLASFVDFVGDEHPAVQATRANLRLVVSRDLPVDDLRARLGALDVATDGFVAGIRTESTRVTLTDRRSTMPLSFRNDTDVEVEVRVTLSSSKLVFPDGATKTIVLPPGRNTQELFEVEARTSGRFTMQVAITSADGNLAVGPPTQITVSSAVFGSIGSWLTYGAFGFLALWWGHHIWRARRRDRIATPGEPT